MTRTDTRPRDWRPDLTPLLEQLVQALIAHSPALSGLRATQILIVALGAHDCAAASVRPLPVSATIDGHRRTIELGLRPLFFLQQTPGARLVTLAHELLHLDPKHPGRLRAEMRHTVASQRVVNAAARAVAKDLMTSTARDAALCLSLQGEMWLRTWTRRPVDGVRTKPTGRDVHLSIVRMHSGIDGAVIDGNAIDGGAAAR